MVVIKGQGQGIEHHPVRVEMSFMLRNSERRLDQIKGWAAKGFKCQTKMFELYPVSSKEPMR